LSVDGIYYMNPPNGFLMTQSQVTLKDVVYRARQKIIPIGKFRYLWNCCTFFR